MSNEPASASRVAIIVLSDPWSGSEEALGRVFNALAAAYDFRAAGSEVQLLFQGAGTRWPAELVKPEHPAHGLFQAVKSSVAGASCGCAEVFGATESAVAAGCDLISESAVPGTAGLPSASRLRREGFELLTF